MSNNINISHLPIEIIMLIIEYLDYKSIFAIYDIYPNVCDKMNIYLPNKTEFWNYISSNCNLPKSFIYRYNDKVNWALILNKYDFPLEFLLKNKKAITDCIKRQSKHIEKLIIENTSLYTGYAYGKEYYFAIKNRLPNTFLDCLAKYQILSTSFIYENQFKFTYNILCQYQKLSDEFIEQHYKKFSHGILCQYQKLSNKFIEKHYLHFDLKNLCKHQKLSDNIIDNILNDYRTNIIKYGHTYYVERDTLTYYLYKYQTISESIVDKYQDIINFRGYSTFQTLTDNIILKYHDKISWEYIKDPTDKFEYYVRLYHKKINWQDLLYYQLKIQNISESFINKYAKNFKETHWYCICKYMKLSESFIEKHINNINWVQLSYNQKLSNSFLIKYQDNVDWSLICINNKLTGRFILNNINIKNLIGSYMTNQIYELLYLYYYEYALINNIDNTEENFIFHIYNNMIIPDICPESINKYWEYLIKRQKLTIGFIIKYKYYFYLTHIVKFYQLPENFLITYENDFEWCSDICKYQNLSISFMDKFSDKLWWKYISKYQLLTEKFITKYKNKIYWIDLIVRNKNNNVCYKFIKYHKAVFEQ